MESNKEASMLVCKQQSRYRCSRADRDFLKSQCTVGKNTLDPTGRNLRYELAFINEW
jgi:hypothetical protein